MIRLEANTPGYRFVTWDDTAIVAWLTPPTVDGAVKMYSFLSTFAATQKDGIYVFVVIGEFQGLPDGATRQVMSESMAKTASFTKQVISVIEGQGFRSAAIRSIASSMQLIARNTAPMKVISEVPTALDLLAKLKGTTSLLEREEMARAVKMATSGS